MAYVGKTYKHSKDENFKPFVDSLGIPEDKAEAVLKSSPTQKIELIGDTYTIYTFDSVSTKELSFKNGIPFNEVLSENYTAKSTCTVDGNVITQVQEFPDGRIMTLKRIYSDKELVVELTSSTFDGSATRYYTAL